MRESMGEAARALAAAAALSGGLSQEALAQDKHEQPAVEHIADQRVYEVADDKTKEMWDKIDKGEYVTRPEAAPALYFDSDPTLIKKALEVQHLRLDEKAGNLLGFSKEQDSIEWAYATYDKDGKFIQDSQAVNLSLESNNDQGVVVTIFNSDLSKDVAIFEGGKMISGHHYEGHLPPGFDPGKPQR